ncbi:MAG TPA: hypothetical protein VE083_00625 [Terriglobales bacterium]|nr:hypothetical protein [Terriglobales bacterium]
MQNSNTSATARRSSRVPANVPILVTSLEPATHFSEVCETLMVSAHGCSMRSPMKLDAGVLVHFHSKEGRETTAKVVYCQPLESDRLGWRLGAKLDRPENFWGLKACPQDWGRLSAPAAPTGDKLPLKLLGKNPQTVDPQPSPIPASLKVTLEKIQKQISDDNLRTMMAELVQPLQAEVTDLREKLARGDSRRSRFEVSLSQIPPELEEQLEQRLRKHLGPRIQEEAREQSAQVLEAAKAAIGQKTTDSHNQFLDQVGQELQSVEQRTKGLASEVAANLRDHLNRRQGEFQQQVVDAGNRLKRLSEELLQVLQHNLGEEHNERRRELEQVQGVVVSEASRVREQVAVLDGRITKLDESARELESGLDKRLGQMASNTVGSTRKQLESAVDAILVDMGTRSSQELSTQLDDACSRLKIVQKGIEASVSESLKIQVGETLKSFEHSMEELAQQAVGRLRITLASGLNSLVTSLGEQFRVGGATNGDSKHPPVD